MMLYLGIDPGASGGLVLLGESDRPAFVAAMPGTERDILEVMREIRACSEDIRGAIELLVSGPKATRKVCFRCAKCGHGNWREEVANLQTPNTQLKMGRNDGLLRMALAACEIPFNELSIGEWQRGMRVWGKKFATASDKKKHHKEVAQRLFPGEKITLKTCDAFLIAYYFRQTQTVKAPC